MWKMAMKSEVKYASEEVPSFAYIYGIGAKNIPSVSTSLEEYDKGKHHGYDILLKALTDGDISSETLLRLLRELRNCASLLGKEHESIVGVLLRVDWLNREEGVKREYQSLILDVISAHPIYLPRILRKLISKFVPDREDCVEKEVIDAATRKKFEVQFVCVHRVLQKISKCVPLMSMCMVDQKLLGQAYPVTARMTTAAATYLQACFVSNVLQILQYLPSLRLTSLELIVSNLLALDVAASRKAITAALDDMEEEEMQEPEMFEMDGVVQEEDSKKTPAPEGMGHPKADCLDHLMKIMFTYVHEKCFKNEELQFEEAKCLYMDLLRVFKILVLRTHNSSHVQYLLFYVCSFSHNGQQRFCTHFVDELWSLVQRADTELQTRRAAAAYLGSFLARAAYIPALTAKTCLELMSQWIHKYIDQTSGESMYANIERFGPFYAVCQAVFYVLCFRSNEFNLSGEKGKQWARSLGIQKMAGSKLNPLHYVSPLVVKIFASVMRQHEIAYLDNIIQWNQRHFLPSDKTEDNLMSFFPFDPYLLKSSKSFIQPLQREYHGNAQAESDSESLHSDMEDDDFLPELPEETPPPLVESQLSRPCDLFHYGTSPGFKHT